MSEENENFSDLEFESDIAFDSDEDFGLENGLDALSLETFRITSLGNVVDRQTSLTSRAADVTQLSSGVCRLLLKATNWDLAELSTSLYDDRDACARRVRLRDSSDFAKLQCLNGAKEEVAIIGGEGRRSRRMLGKGFECPICFSQTKPVDAAALGCRHFVCRSCFAMHIKIRLIHDRKLYSTTCPGSLDCPLLVTSDTVAELTPQYLQQLFQLTAQLYVDSSPQFRHCPFPGCESIIEKLVGDKLRAVECTCGGTFCFECGLPYSHYAVPCEIATRWLALVDHEHRSAKWVLENTKACPQCQSKIERSEGCNHMSCANCHFEFCWMCSQDWSEHSGKSYYNCVKYVPSKSEASVSKKQGERIHFYVLRYENHTTLAAAVDDLSTKQAHGMLAWAYVLLCTAAYSTHQILLEELVSDLVKAIEDASQLVKQRAQALNKFLMDTKWAIDPVIAEKLIIC